MKNSNRNKMGKRGKSTGSERYTPQRVFGGAVDFELADRNRQPLTSHNWREMDQYQVSTSESEDIEFESEQEVEKLDKEIEETLAVQRQKQQVERLLTLETQKREEAEQKRKDAEALLANALKELAVSKQANTKDRAEAQLHITPEVQIERKSERNSDSDRESLIRYTKRYFSDPRNTTTKGTITLLAEELERDLHIVEKSAMTEVAAYVPEKESHLSLTTGARKQMADHKAQIEDQKNKLKSIIKEIKIMENSNTPEKFEQEIQEAQDKYNLEKTKYIEKKQEWLKAEEIAQRYEPRLESPEYISPPREYTRGPNVLNMKNITTNVPKFDPDSTSDNNFENTWTAALQFGSLEYFEEEQYHQVLATVLRGQALRSYKDMRKTKCSLRHILDTFAELYGAANTIEEDQAEVDNFKRKPNESIKRAMSRLSFFVERLRCLYDPAAWKEISYNMLKQTLMQIISEKTRSYIEHEEAKIKKLGVKYTMKDLIDQIYDYEVSHKTVPKGEVATVHQVASGQPQVWANDLKNRQKAITSQKHEATDIGKIAQLISKATTQVASAILRERSVSKGRKDTKPEKSTYRVKKGDKRSTSTHSNYNDKGTEVETDVEMTDTEEENKPKKNWDKNSRADKNSRGRSGQRQSSTPARKWDRTYSNESARNGSSYQKRDYSRDKYQKRDQSVNKKEGKNYSNQRNSRRDYSRDNSEKRGYSRDNSKKRDYSKENRSSSKDSKYSSSQKQGKGQITIDNKIYYTCPCASMHLLGAECPTKAKLKN